MGHVHILSRLICCKGKQPNQHHETGLAHDDGSNTVGVIVLETSGQIVDIDGDICGYICWLVVSTYPSEKWWSSSVGMMKFPIYGKSSKPCSKLPTSIWIPVDVYGFSCVNLEAGTTGFLIIGSTRCFWQLMAHIHSQFVGTKRPQPTETSCRVTAWRENMFDFWLSLGEMKVWIH